VHASTVKHGVLDVGCLRSGDRLQIGDILVETAVPEEGKRDIDLWKG